MLNFDYLKQFPELATLYGYCNAAERNQYAQPDTSAINARRALEWMTHAIYHLLHEEEPERASLYDLVSAQVFIEFIDDLRLINAVHYIRKIGNLAAHMGNLRRKESFFALTNLYNFVGSVLLKLEIIQTLEPFKTGLIPKQPGMNVATADVVPSETLLFAKSVNPDAINKAPDIQPAVSWDNISEAETRIRFIDLLLREAGWEVLENDGEIQPGKACIEIEVHGMPNGHGVGYADYVLFGPDRKPLAVVEAKSTSKDPAVGEHQAELYADCLEKQYGVRPVIYFTNGFKIFIIDRLGYPKRQLAAFHRMSDLQLLQQRQGRADIVDMKLKPEIADRYYQIAAVRAICEHFNQKHRRGLLVMATGTGKTRTAISLVDVMQRAGWVKHTLFLADRTSLVLQAMRNFSKLLPGCTCTNLTEHDHDPNARLVFSTYQTMINYVDADEKPFSVGHFDLIIVDEAHRSIFDKYKAIFSYFDALLVGLTATPREQVNRSTYDIFELEQGEPNYAYEYGTAVSDGCLVPFRGRNCTSGVLTYGIKYDSLSEEQRQVFEDIWEWEALQSDIEGKPKPEPRDIEKEEIFKYIYNIDTIDKMLGELMQNGLRVESGEKIGKTIIFAMNRRHAETIVTRFNKLYPQLGNDFCKQIDYSINYAQNLIDKFGIRGDMPQIAVSVDMLDTGIDVPDILNLVFFKHLQSKIKFWQMIGRGTRLSPGIFGPGKDKKEFYIFDWCGNFDFFGENPPRIETERTKSLTERIFSLRCEIAYQLQAAKYQTDGSWTKKWHDELKDLLHKQVFGLNDARISVRTYWDTVAYYRNKANWRALTAVGVNDLQKEVAPLLTTAGGNESALKFDLLALRVQLSILEETSNNRIFENRIKNIAKALAKLGSVPQVLAKQDVIQEVLTSSFWEKKTLSSVERMRNELRELIQFLTGKDGKTFDVNVDDLVDVSPIEDEMSATMSYKQKVLDYLTANRNHPVLQKIQNLQQLTAGDINELEEIFWKELGTHEDYERYLLRENLHKDMPVAALIRKLQGVNREEAVQLFAKFLQTNTLTTDQQDYLESILDYVCQNGDIEVNVLLNEAPFDNLEEDRIFPGNFDKVGAFVVQLHGAINVA